MSAPLRPAADVTRDVIGLLTAIISGDEQVIAEVLHGLEDPDRVLAGLSGFLMGLLPAWAGQLGIDLAGDWSQVAGDASLRLARGERLS